MHQANFRFYAELNDFLPPALRGQALLYRFAGSPALKDSIEAQGVPHTEVDLILANGVSVDFAYRLQDRDAISVYPVFEALDITPLLRLRAAPLRVSRFVVDSNLGKLAVYLRLLGFDTLYRNAWDDAELVCVSRDQRRILLTRDQGVLKRNLVTHGYYPRQTEPKAQAREVLQRFDLYRAIKPFCRCLRCNGEVVAVDKSEVEAALLPRTRAHYQRFYRCRDCHRVYWEGSHHARMQELVAELTAVF